MNINLKKTGCVHFCDIYPGDVFGMSGDIYMKTESVSRNAVNLKTGDLFTFYNIDKVLPYPNATLDLRESSNEN